VAHSGLEYDDCNVCNGLNVAKDCNGECFGLAVVDGCAVCAGGNTDFVVNSTLDCAGYCGGVAQLDFCGECYGGESDILKANSTLDCNNVCGGPFKVGLCGVCEDPAFPGPNQTNCDGTCRDTYTPVAEECPDENPVVDPCEEAANARLPECFKIDTIHPKSSSYAGGVTLAITGKGFKSESSYQCKFKYGIANIQKEQFLPLSETEGTCTVPKLGDSAIPEGTQKSWPDFSFSIEEYVGNTVVETTPVSFTYFKEGKAQPTSIVPDWGYVKEETTVLISGTGFEGVFPDLTCYARKDGAALFTVAANITDAGLASCLIPAMPSGMSGAVDVYLLLTGDVLDFDSEAASKVTFKYLAPAAAMDSIRFTNDLRALEVLWNQPIVNSGSPDCSSYFSSSTAEQKLQGSTCTLVTSQLLRVLLGSQSRVVPFLQLTSNEDVGLVNHASDLTENVTSSTAVSAWPLNAVEPFADLQVPSIIPMCGNLVLSASHSYGGGYPGLKYFWAVYTEDETVDGFKVVAKKLASLDGTVAKVEIDSDTFTANVDYTFVLTVESTLSASTNTASTSSATLAKAGSAQAASVRIVGPSAISIGANEKLVVRGETTNNCYDVLDERSHSWGIDLCIEDSCSGVESAGFSLLDMSSSPLLHLPANILTPGRRYRLRLTETPTASPKDSTSATVLVDVLAPVLSCEVKGGNVQVSSESGGNLVLTADVVGSDPEIAAAAARWECTTSTGGACYLKSVGSFQPLGLPTGGSVTVPLASIYAGTYTFSAKPTAADGSWTLCSTTVTLVDGGISPIISIISAPTGSAVPSEIVRIQARVIWPVGIPLITEFVSTLIDGDASSDVVAMESSALITPAQVEHPKVGEYGGTSNEVTSTIVPLAFRANALKAGVRYFLKISTRLPDNCKCGELVDASASLVLQMASGASGSVSVEPSSVTALSEFQTMSAVNFANPDGSASVAHTFYLQVDGRDIALGSFSYSSSVSVLMPRTEAPAYLILESVADNGVLVRSSPVELSATALPGFSADTLTDLASRAVGLRDDQNDWNRGLATLTAVVIQLNRGVPSELAAFAEGGEYHEAALKFKAAVVDYIGHDVAYIVREGPEAVERCLAMLREVSADGPTGVPSAATKTAADALVKEFIGGYTPKTRAGALRTAGDALSALADVASGFDDAAALAKSLMGASDSEELIEADGVQMMLNPGGAISFVGVSGGGGSSAKTVQLSGLGDVPYAGTYEEAKEESGYNLAGNVVALGEAAALGAFSVGWEIDSSTDASALRCVYRVSGSVEWAEAKHASIPRVTTADPTNLNCEFNPAFETLRTRRSKRSTSDSSLDFGLGQPVATTTTTITTTTTSKTTVTTSTFTATKTTVTTTKTRASVVTTEEPADDPVEWQGEVLEASISSADGKAASFSVDPKLMGSVAGVILIVVVSLILGYRSLKKRNHKVTAEEHAVWAEEVDRRVSMHAAGKNKNHLFKGVSEPQGTAELREDNTLMTALRTRQLGRQWKAKALASKSAWGSMPTLTQNHVNSNSFSQAAGRGAGNQTPGFGGLVSQTARSPKGRLAPIGQPVASPLPNTMAYDQKVAQQEAEEEAAIKAMTNSQQFNARGAPTLPPVRTAANPNAGVAWLPSQDAKDQQRQDESESSDSDDAKA